jgi:hypothetical protein
MGQAWVSWELGDEKRFRLANTNLEEMVDEKSVK